MCKLRVHVCPCSSNTLRKYCIFSHVSALHIQFTKLLDILITFWQLNIIFIAYVISMGFKLTFLSVHVRPTLTLPHPYIRSKIVYLSIFHYNEINKFQNFNTSQSEIHKAIFDNFSLKIWYWGHTLGTP